MNFGQFSEIYLLRATHYIVDCDGMFGPIVYVLDKARELCEMGKSPLNGLIENDRQCWLIVPFVLLLQKWDKYMTIILMSLL